MSVILVVRNAASRWRWLLAAVAVVVAVVLADSVETSGCISTPGSAEGMVCTVAPVLDGWLRFVLAIGGLAAFVWMVSRQARRDALRRSR